MGETFTLDAFCGETWSDDPQYSSHGPSYEHVLALHEAKPHYEGRWFCDDREMPAFCVFLHFDGIRFEFYLYEVNGWMPPDFNPVWLEPVMWIYGTDFDGVRESSGAQNFSADMRDLAAALQWVHAFACERWPRFKKWYA